MNVPDQPHKNWWRCILICRMVKSDDMNHVIIHIALYFLHGYICNDLLFARKLKYPLANLRVPYFLKASIHRCLPRTPVEVTSQVVSGIKWPEKNGLSERNNVILSGGNSKKRFLMFNPDPLGKIFNPCWREAYFFKWVGEKPPISELKDL